MTKEQLKKEIEERYSDVKRFGWLEVGAEIKQVDTASLSSEFRAFLSTSNDLAYEQGL